MAVRLVDISGGAFTSSTLKATPASLDFAGETSQINDMYDEGSNVFDATKPDNENYTIFDNGIMKIECSNAGGGYTMYYYVYYNNTLIYNYSVSTDIGSGQKSPFIGFAFGVDDDTQKGMVWACAQVNYYGAYYIYTVSHATLTPTQMGNVYLAITESEQPPYTWSSVPAISGKNGILPLSMIKNEELGDGSPVTDASMLTINRLSGNTSLSALSNTMTGNFDYPVLYSGDNYKMLMSVIFAPIIGWTVTFKFYLLPTTGGQENLIYSYAKAVTDLSRAYLSFIVDDENEVGALSIIETHIDNQVEYVDYNTPGTGMTAEEMSLLYIWLHAGKTDNDDPEGVDSFEDNDPNGGGGLTHRYNNAVPKPGEPGKSAVMTGFVSLWHMTDTQIRSLAEYLWSNDFFDIINKRLYSDPKDAIVNLMIMPYEPTHDNVATNIFVCGRNTGQTGQRIRKQWETIPMGRVTIPNLLENGAYFDFSPYTTIKIWLPFAGEHELDCSDVVGKTLELEYLIDNLSGVCVANLNIVDPEAGDETKGDHYYFGGQMGIKIPVSASDFSGVYSAVLSAGATIGAGLATASSGGMTAPIAMGVVANVGNNVANMTPTYCYSSGGGAISGALGGEYPFILISEPNVFEATDQRKYIGYPCLSTYRLSDMSGFVKVHEIHVDGVVCTEYERDQIKTALTGGVVIQTGTVITTEDITPENPDCIPILFLKNISDKNEFGKKFKTVSGEIDGALLECQLLTEQSVERPIIIVGENVSEYNYMYIPEFKRFYYINDIEYKAGGIQYVHGEVDPLQSFKDDILNCNAIISDCGEPGKAKYLCNNNSWFMQQNKNVVTLLFTDEYKRPVGFKRGSNSQESYVLALSGDGEQT